MSALLPHRIIVYFALRFSHCSGGGLNNFYSLLCLFDFFLAQTVSAPVLLAFLPLVKFFLMLISIYLSWHVCFRN